MMEAPYLSIIIPVYNLKDYIIGCLQSIYSQDVDENLYEVVAIDDGSTDDSLSLLNGFSQKHQNLKVLHQENGGVSSARNNGIRHCSAPFITFVDADDEILPTSFQKVIDLIARENVFDVIYLRTFCTDDNKELETHLWMNFFKEGCLYKGEEILRCHYLNGGSVCGGIYRKEFLADHNLWFAIGVANSEDAIFNLLLNACNPNVIFRSIPFNLFRIRDNSASHSNSFKRVEKFKNNLSYLHELHNKNYNSLQNQAIDMGAYYSISHATTMYLECGGTDWNYLYNVLRIDKLCHGRHLVKKLKFIF